MQSWQLQEAKNRLSELVEAALQGVPGDHSPLDGALGRLLAIISQVQIDSRW